MQNSLAVNVFECPEQTATDGEHFHERQRTGLQSFVQRDSRNMFRDEKEVFIITPRTHQGHDPRALQVEQYTRFMFHSHHNADRQRARWNYTDAYWFFRDKINDLHIPQ